MSLAAMANVSMVVVLFFLIFAILGVQLFAGKFWACNDAAVPDRAACVGTFVSPDTGEVRGRRAAREGQRRAGCAAPAWRPSLSSARPPGARGAAAALLTRSPPPPHLPTARAHQALPRVWSNAAFNFDHLGTAMVTLFVVSTLNGYQEIVDMGAGGGGSVGVTGAVSGGGP